MVEIKNTELPAQLLGKYDGDEDKALSAAELGWQTNRLASLDENSDGELNARELKYLVKSIGIWK